MKKWVAILLLMLLLTGCGAQETFETLGQVDHQSNMPGPLQQVLLALPEHAAMEAVNQDTGITVYTCDDYYLVLQTSPAGDLAGTVQTASGFKPAQLTMVETACGDHARYDWVWTAVSEEGEMVCRGAVLDDGVYHYSLCAVATSAVAGKLQQQWNDLFASFCLTTE